MDVRICLIIPLLFLYIANGEDVLVKENELVKVVASERNGSANFTLKFDRYVRMFTCEMTLPDGTIYQIVPSSNINDPNIEKIGDNDNECGFIIKNVTADYMGLYEINILSNTVGYTINTTIFQPLNVIVEEKINILPTNTLEVFQGQDIEIYLSEHIDNFKNCEIVDPNSKEAKTYFSNFTNCLLQLQNITKEMNGIWIIKAIGEVILYDEMNLTVMDVPKVEQNITLVLGVPAILTLGPTESVFCQTINPSGHKVVQNSGQCILNINRVTDKDAGIWKVLVGLTGSISIFTYEYFVHVIDLGEQNENEILTYSEVSKNGSCVQIECTLLAKSMKSCRMIRSDGEIFIMSKGIITNRYKYYTQDKEYNENSVDYVSCGIHIDKPELIDIMPWTCIIVHGDDNIETGSIINPYKLTNTTGSVGENSIISVTNIDGAKNRPFEMICKYPAPISYCWFTSPNGTIYSLVPDSNYTDYEYYGDGLKMGHCGMKIKAANIMNKGIWKCNIGTSETIDLKANIFVNVHETPLVAERKLYRINKGDKISCSTFNNSTLEYCRFIRPNGDGVNPSKNSYSYSDNGTNLERGYCQLLLLSPSNFDDGLWTCIAKPHFENIEYYDTFVIETNYNYFYNGGSSNVVFWIMFVIAMTVSMTIFIIALRKIIIEHREKCRTRQERRSNPPPYTFKQENKNDMQKVSLA